MKRRSFIQSMFCASLLSQVSIQAQQSQTSQQTQQTRWLRPVQPTFFRVPSVDSIDKLNADAAFVGIPYDLGVTSRPGTKFGPSALREAYPGPPSNDTNVGWYDYELEERILTGVKLADVGNVIITPAEITPNLDRMTAALSAVLSRGALPVVLGGDHSISFPVLRAYKGVSKKIHIIHFDSHLDFGGSGGGDDTGQSYTHADPMRHAINLPWVSGLTSIGIRGLQRGARQLEEGKKRGVQVLTAWKVLQMGLKEAIASIPQAESYYVSFDVDVLDPSLSPGPSTPVPGGFSYYQAKELLTEIANKGNIVGLDFVEVCPPYDTNNVTARITARLVMDFLGAIFKQRQKLLK